MDNKTTGQETERTTLDDSEWLRGELGDGSGNFKVRPSAIGRLAPGALRYEPFFGDKNILWSRPALDIGGSPDAFNTWLNQSGNPDRVVVSNPAEASAVGWAVDAGSGYAVGNTITTAGGTVLTVSDLILASAAINTAGSGGTPGPVLLSGPWTNGNVVKGTINGSGHLASIEFTVGLDLIDSDPGSLTGVGFDPADGNPISGVTLNITMGVATASVTTPGSLESNPVSQASTSGAGTGAKFNLMNNSRPAVATDNANGLPLVLQMDSANLGGSVEDICGLLKPLGAGPWKITNAFVAPAAGTLQAYPFILYDSVCDRALAVSWVNNFADSNMQIGFDYFSPTTPFGSSASTKALTSIGGQSYLQWFQLENDGTYLILRVSYENKVFTEIHRRKLSNIGDSFDFVGWGAPRGWYGRVQTEITVGLWNWVEETP